MTYDMRRVAAIQKALREWFVGQGHEVDSSFAIIEVECSGDDDIGWVGREEIDLLDLAEHLDKELNK